MNCGFCYTPPMLSRWGYGAKLLLVAVSPCFLPSAGYAALLTQTTRADFLVGMRSRIDAETVSGSLRLDKQFAPNARIDPRAQQQNSPHLIGGTDGSLLAIWDLFTQTGNTDVYFSRSTDRGRSWLSPVRVDDATVAGFQGGAKLHLGSAGTLYAVWSDDRRRGFAKEDIFFSKSVTLGSTWSANVRVNDADMGRNFEPAVVQLPTGDICVAWSDGRSGTQKIRFSRSINDGASWLGSVAVNPFGSGSEGNPNMVADGQGVLYLVFDGAVDTAIFFTKSTDRGVTWSPVARVNDASPGFRFNSSLALDASGGLHVSFTDTRDGPDRIFYAHSLDGGNTWGANLPLHALVPGSARQSTIANDGRNLYVAWQDDRRGNLAKQIFFTRSTDGGTTWTTPSQLEDTEVGDRLAPTLTSDADGNLAAAWMDNRLGTYHLFFTRTEYFPSGVFESATLDTGGRSNFGKVIWSVVAPSAVGLDSARFQIATNNDGVTWNFSGPDGTGGSFYTVSTGETIFQGHNGNRFVRYRAFLQTANVDFTPRVDDVSIEFQQITAITGQVFSDGSPVSGAQITTSAGPSAQTGTDGRFSLQVPAGSLKVRATLPAGQFQEQDVIVREGQTVDLVFRFTTARVAPPAIEDPSPGAILSAPFLVVRGNAPPNTTVRILLGGLVIGTVPSTEGGLFDFRSPQPIADGTYQLTAVAVDATGATSDPTPARQITIRTTLPDLQVRADDIQLSESAFRVGQTVTVFATVRNVGRAGANNVVVAFDENGKSLGQRTVASLAPGESQVVGVPWLIDGAGIHVLRVLADPGGAILELDEANNQAIHSVSIGVTVDPSQAAVVTAHFNSPGVLVTLTPGFPASISGSAFYNPDFFGANKPMAGSRVTVSLDGIGEVAQGLVSADGTFSVRFYGPSTPGLYVVRVRASNGTVAGTASPLDLSVVPVAGIELVVADIDVTFSAPQHTQGQTETIAAVVHNVGDTGATGVKVRLFDNDVLRAEQMFSLVPAQGQVTASFSYNFPDFGNGERVIKVEAAPLPGEVSPSNNIGARTIRLIPASSDLTARDLVFSNNVPQAGSPVTVTAEILNLGATPVKASDNLVARFFVEGAPAGDVVIPDIPAATSQTPPPVSVSQSIVFPQASLGAEVRVEVDFGNKLLEASEANNAYFEHVRVEAAPGAPALAAPVPPPGTLGPGGTEPANLHPVRMLFSREKPVNGDVVTANLDVTNLGGTEATNIPVQFLVNGVQVGGLETIPALGLGAVFTVTKNFTVVTGDQTVFARVDPPPPSGGVIPEQSDLDNDLQRVLFAYPTLLPDLSIQSADMTFLEGGVSQTTVSPGATITIRAVIRNTGNALTFAENVPVQVLVDGNVKTTVTVPFIALDGTAVVDVSHTVPLTPAFQLVEVKVDPANVVPEFENAANNTAARVVVVGTPLDLAVESAGISFSDPNPNEGKVVTLSAVVKNLGPVNAPGVAVDFFDRDPAGNLVLIGRTTVTVPGNNQFTASVTWDTTGKKGAHEIVVVVRTPDGVVEPNVLNNTASKAGLSVGVPPGVPSGLGPAVLVTGGYTKVAQPTLSFMLNDLDVSDTVQYRIQISRDAAFSTGPTGIVVDYTSALGVKGARSFTVGQAPNGGAYAVSVPALADGQYFWRVQAIDNDGVAGGVAVANGGMVAFTVDTIRPTVPANTLVIPNGGEQWDGDSVQTISWSAGAISDLNLGPSPISLLYSLDAGVTWTLIASGLANTGSFGWTVPLANSQAALVRVTATDLAGNFASDQSDAVFTIRTPDLATSNLSASRFPPAGPNPQLRLSADVRNVGLLAAPGNVTVLFEVRRQDGTTVDSKTKLIASGLQPGQTLNVFENLLWPGDGTFVVRVTADAGNAVREPDEANNLVNQTITISGNNVVFVSACTVPPGVTAFFATFTGVEIVSGTTVTSFVMDPQIVDLVARHQDGTRALLAGARLPAGRYDGYRYLISSARGVLTDGTTVEFTGVPAALAVPLAVEIGSLSVTEVTAFVDLAASVDVAGRRFQPRLLKVDTAREAGELRAVTPRAEIFAGLGGSFHFDLMNTGTVLQTVDLAANTTAPVQVTVSLASTTTSPGQTAHVTVDVFVPASVRIPGRFSVTLAGTPRPRLGAGNATLPPVLEATADLEVRVDTVPPEVVWHSPAGNATGVCQVVKGTQTFILTIQDDHLTKYVVEVAAGKDVNAGFLRLAEGTQPLSQAVLMAWNPLGRSGWQTLRVVASDAAENVTTAPVSIYLGDPELAQTIGPEIPGLSVEKQAESLHHPEAVDVGADGTRWVADTERNRVLAFRADGTVRLVVGELDDDLRIAPALTRVALRLKEPGGIRALANGGAVVADTGQHRLVVLSSAGVVRQVLGRAGREGESKSGAGAGEFNHPRGVDVDASGNLYVADTENHRFQVLSATGTPLLVVPLSRVPEVDDGDDEDGKESWEVEDAQPIGIVRERTGTHLYVSERKSGQVLIFTLDAGVAPSTATFTGTLGGGPGTFKTPWHLAGTAQGHVYVAERNKNRVRKFDRFGAELLAFGLGPDQAKEKTVPLRLDRPTGVGVGPNGELAVAVREDDRIKIYDKPGVLAPASVAAAPRRPARDLSALGPPHDFALGPNPARAGAPVTIFYVSGWTNQESECRVYTGAGELVCAAEGAQAAPRAVAWGAPGYAPGRYAVAWSGRNQSGEPLASGMYLIQLKVRNPETGEVVPTLKKVLVIR